LPLVELDVLPEQAVIIEHPARIKILAIARRWGKTTLLLLYLVKGCLENPGCKCLYVCQNYSNSLAFKRALWLAGSLRDVIAKDYSQFPPRFQFINGSTLEFKSFDKPGSLWGGGYKAVGIDEACLADEAVFQQTILPMVSDTRGVVILASNYQRGRDWFWTFAQYGKTEKAWAEGVKTWEYKTSEGAAFQTEDGKKELERLKRILPAEVFRCQFENEPLTGENAVFRWTFRNETAAPVAGPQSGHNYIQGLDLGRVQDPSFSVIIDAPDEVQGVPQTANIVYAERFPLGMAYEVQAAKAADLARAWNNALTVADDTGSKGGAAPAKEPFWHFFKNEFDKDRNLDFKPFHFNAQSKFTMVNNLALEIAQTRVICPPPDKFEMFGQLVNQIKIFTHYISGSHNFIRYDAPKGEHDDGVCALGMAVYGKSMGWAKPRIVRNDVQPFRR
jgi:hypothetical protein